MKLFNRLLSSKGQNAIEFAIIAALVTAGIIITGPYVVRSWNAQIRAYETSVRDSYTESLEQGDPIPMENLPCSCTPVLGNGPDTCNIKGCGQYKYYKGRTCDPTGCDDLMEECIESELCCKDGQDLNCWGHPDNQIPSVTDNITCTPGQRVFRQECGLGATNYRCEDDDSCIFECNGTKTDGTPTGDYYQDWCYPDSYNIDVPYGKWVTYIKNGTCSNYTPPEDPQYKCLMECLPSFQGFSDTCGCPANVSYKVGYETHKDIYSVMQKVAYGNSPNGDGYGIAIGGTILSSYYKYENTGSGRVVKMKWVKYNGQYTWGHIRSFQCPSWSTKISKTITEGRASYTTCFRGRCTTIYAPARNQKTISYCAFPGAYVGGGYGNKTSEYCWGDAICNGGALQCPSGTFRTRKNPLPLNNGWGLPSGYYVCEMNNAI